MGKEGRGGYSQELSQSHDFVCSWPAQGQSERHRVIEMLQVPLVPHLRGRRGAHPKHNVLYNQFPAVPVLNQALSKHRWWQGAASTAFRTNSFTFWNHRSRRFQSNTNLPVKTTIPAEPHKDGQGGKLKKRGAGRAQQPAGFRACTLPGDGRAHRAAWAARSISAASARPRVSKQKAGDGHF